MATVVQRSSDSRAAGFRVGNGVVYRPDTDNCSIELSRGNFVVYFEDGHADPAEVGFSTLVEAQDFISKSSKALRDGKVRPYRIEDTGTPAGQPLKFVEPSLVHASVAEVVAENRLKEEIRADVAAQYPNADFDWKISSVDRAVEIIFNDATDAQTKIDLEANLANKFGINKVRIL